MKILVTGGAGFIGSHLVDALIEKKHRVVVIDDLSLGQKRNLNKKAKFYRLDVQSERIEAVFKKEQFDYVFHLAAQINVRKSVADPIFDAKVNIIGTLNLLECCQKYKIRKFIFASSGGVMYGDTKIIPTPESQPARPISPYGISKHSVEQYLGYYKKEFGLDYTILRYANVYGPRQNPEGEAGVIAIFLSKLLKGEGPIINGDGKQTRDYVFVKDVVRANVLGLTKKGNLYNIGTGKETNVIELFEKIRQLGNFAAKEKHGPALRGEQKRSCLDSSKIRKEWGFRSKYDLTTGISETLEWFKDRI
ncbi:MAG: UDP-glucose 4-epimerase [Candidatus Kerfeldbacteria bacterium CG_4_10_14_0_8_um_filter_42_10]|uniref:UDP-glucose 4-epimerase n=1 Tax=Candidatus Kerfeldbacteria bacterium CG_4_10_14_0_8_um_filter_42_10 TaxID=2014248 RepID=A0A2M7RL83_9BACT|nr:MAG: UDP-glucose 4-epimerase [Candidatus Kerfeldbacteria bacterium CG_4_10_14_0_8_um_filter_42_10]